jgi:uncharacterized repeat protein (TIGR04076 family)
MRNVKITVLKKEFYPEYAAEYLTDGVEAGPCPILETGQEFIYKGGAEMPTGLCPWAWIDIYNGVSSMSNGASLEPWYNRAGLTILCCSDGVRPVVFKIETID